jgi:transcriptional regulator with GAF, ATPase, and Fis domain
LIFHFFARYICHKAAVNFFLGVSLAADLPPEIQPKLLRALEEKTILPVGADAELKVNVRILAATNQDLSQLIAQGPFRRDLYERLAQLVLRLPPLRERQTDIPLLIRRFLREWNTAYREEKQISE